MPDDTITYTVHIEQGGQGTYIIDDTITPDNPATVLGFSFLRPNVSIDSILKSGETTIFANFAKDVSYVSSNYLATGTLAIEKTGREEEMILVNYVRRDTSTTSPEIENNLTYGDALIAFFIVIGLVGAVFGFLAKRFIGK